MSKKRKPLTFSDQIRAAVLDCDKSRYAIAQETGIDAAALCRFVHGQVGLQLDSLDRLADCIGLRVVVEGENKPKRSKGW